MRLEVAPRSPSRDEKTMKRSTEIVINEDKRSIDGTPMTDRERSK